ncbi:MAG: Maf family protein [Micropepsaceae bacterium]
MSTLILASGSAARQRMLRAAGVEFSVQTAAIDEEAILQSLQAEEARPRDMADLLAELKAVKVSTSRPETWVIGADQVLSLGKECFQKPGTLVKARQQLLRLKGKVHVLSSAVCVAKNGSVVWRFVGEARLTMRDFTDQFLESYLVEAGEEILGSVGAYHVEGLGLQLFSDIDGDLFTIQGMPMLPLLDYLRLNGVLNP